MQDMSGGSAAEKEEEEENTKDEQETKSEKDFYSMEELESLDDESVAYLAKRFSKLKFQRPKGVRKFMPKQSGEKKTLIDKSKIKCYKCNIMGHFANKCRSKDNGKGKGKEDDSTNYKRSTLIFLIPISQEGLYC